MLLYLKKNFSTLLNNLEEVEDQKGKFEVQLVEVNDLLNGQSDIIGNLKIILKKTDNSG